MKSLQVSFTLALQLLSASLVQAQGAALPVKASTRLQLHAEIEPASVKRGTQVVVKFRLKNTFFMPIRIADNGAIIDYDLVVTDAAGKEPPRTDLGKRISRGEYTVLRSVSIDLEPGQEIEASLDVASLYEITQPGTYQVQGIRGAIFGDPSEMERRNSGQPVQSVEKAFSNVVQFTLLP